MMQRYFATALLSLVGASATSYAGNCYKATFAKDKYGRPLMHGDDPAGVQFPGGITVVSPKGDQLGVYDTNFDGGLDPDLEVDRGNAIIVQDPRFSSPNDWIEGGRMQFEFDEPVTIKYIEFIDIDNVNETPKISFFKTDGLRYRESGVVTGDGNWQQAFYNKEDVTKVFIKLPGSGAVNKILFCKPDVCTPEECDDGDVCNGMEICDPIKGCKPGYPLECDDHNICNGKETCDPELGCVPGHKLECEDKCYGNWFLDYECNPYKGCELKEETECKCGCDPYGCKAEPVCTVPGEEVLVKVDAYGNKFCECGCPKEIFLDQLVRTQRKPTGGVSPCEDPYNKIKNGGVLKFEYNFGTTIVSGQDSDKAAFEKSATISCDSSALVIVSDKDKISEAEKDNVFIGTLNCGDIFETSGDFSSNTYVHVVQGDNHQLTKFHTSCSQPLAIGDVYGSVEIVGFTDEKGQTVEAEEPDFGPGGTKTATGAPGDTIIFTYLLSTTEAEICEDTMGAVVASDTTRSGEVYLPAFFDGDTNGDGCLNEGETWRYTFAFEFTGPVGTYTATSNTRTGAGACSASASATVVIEVPPFEGDVCEECGKPTELTWTYQPGDQNLSKQTDKSDLVTRSSWSMPDTAYILACNDDNCVFDSNDAVFFSGTVSTGSTFVTSNNGEELKAEGSNMYIHIWDSETQFKTGVESTQYIQYHVSCSDLITLGDVIGSVQLSGFVGSTCSF